MAHPELRIEHGSLLLDYCFDVGEEILLDRIESIFGEAPTTSHLVVERLTPAYVQYRRAPLLIEVGQFALSTHYAPAVCRAKLYDFGVISIIFKLSLQGELKDLVGVATEFVGNPKVYQLARAQLQRLRSALAPGIVQTSHSEETEWEDYAIFSIEVKLDVSEVIEKVTNSLKLIGDPYLARVYTRAATRFGLSAWEASLRHKLATVESLYELLYERTQARQLLVLELLIVILFVLDILLLLVEPLIKR